MGPVRACSGRRRHARLGHASAEATAFEQAVVAFPEIVACHMVSGEVDYLLEVVVPTWIITGASCSASCLSFQSFVRSARTLRSRPSRQERCCPSITWSKPNSGH